MFRCQSLIVTVIIIDFSLLIRRTSSLRYCHEQYDLNRTLDEIRPYYHMDETCQKTVPEAINAFNQHFTAREVDQTISFPGFLYYTV